MLFSRKKQRLPAFYTDVERTALEAHITKYFGNIAAVIHDIDSSDINVDIAVIAPTSERNFFTLVTIGMGAYRMERPREMSKFEIIPEYAELLICLPPDWDMQGILKGATHDKNCYWPVRLLRDTAHIPAQDNILIDQGSFFSTERPYADNTKLCGVLAAGPDNVFDEVSWDTEKHFDVCVMPGGKEVNFFQLVPLYRDEIEYLSLHAGTSNEEEAIFYDYLYTRGTVTLENAVFSMIVDITRKSIMDYIDA